MTGCGVVGGDFCEGDGGCLAVTGFDFDGVTCLGRLFCVGFVPIVLEPAFNEFWEVDDVGFT